MKKERIGNVWPLIAEVERKPDDISRLNHTGTYPVHTDLAIGDAIDFYNIIGVERKEARLRFMQNYWTSKVRDLPNVLVNTPADPGLGCIASVTMIFELADKSSHRVALNFRAVELSPSSLWQRESCKFTPK